MTLRRNLTLERMSGYHYMTGRPKGFTFSSKPQILQDMICIARIYYSFLQLIAIQEDSALSSRQGQSENVSARMLTCTLEVL